MRPRSLPDADASRWRRRCTRDALIALAQDDVEPGAAARRRQRAMSGSQRNVGPAGRSNYVRPRRRAGGQAGGGARRGGSLRPSAVRCSVGLLRRAGGEQLDSRTPRWDAATSTTVAHEDAGQRSAPARRGGGVREEETKAVWVSWKCMALAPSLERR